MTKDELDKMLEEKGELAVAEAMAIEQIDATLELLNSFVEKSPWYRHPMVTIPYAVELMMIMITETLEPKDYLGVLDNIVNQLNDAVAVAVEMNAPANSDQEPDEFAPEKIDG